MEVQKKLPIGIENFKDLFTENFYYIDKTGLIVDLLNNWGKVNLFTRPRRFGKSLNMNMLKTFFEIGCDPELFRGLTVASEKELCDTYMGKFPVISISLKNVNGTDLDMACRMMAGEILREVERFQFLADSDRLTGHERQSYKALLSFSDEDKGWSDELLLRGLRILCGLLHKHYGELVIVLIDEYDVPLAKAFERGYYDTMIVIIRNIFEQVLKTNDDLYLAVLTGCMRISKESIFTGLNNLKVLSISDVRFAEYFGFTDGEVRRLLADYGLSGAYETVREWYDGYRFGNIDVYCPWDVLNYCDLLRADPTALPENYWANTSSNDAVRRFIEMAGNQTTKREIEQLVAGETIEKEIHQELTYKDMYQSIDNLWSVLFTSGYLTQRARISSDRFCLAIPNMEIRMIFTKQIMEFFKSSVEADGAAVNVLCEALKNGDAKGVEQSFSGYLRRTISIRDTFAKRKLKENFYHGIMLGILGFKSSWGISSNREAGDGYSDIVVEIEEPLMGIIIEMKYAQDGDLEGACQKALAQIETSRYEEILEDEGIDRILKYGIACYKKRCRVVCDTSKA